MKAMENYLNILHFCFYKAHYKSHLFANKINPFTILAETSFIKNRLEKKGITNIEKEINKAFGDKKFGLSTTVAGGILWGAMAILFFSILMVFNVFVYATTPYIFACAVLSGGICYFFVFRNDKYIKYFDKYEKWTKAEKRKNTWLTLASLFAIFLLFYLGLKP
jgi:hypothetical protein